MWPHVEDFSWLEFTMVDFMGYDWIKVCKGGISQFPSFPIQQDHMECEVKNMLVLEEYLGPLVCASGKTHVKCRKLIVAIN